MITDWLHLATAGKTVDGRTIKAEWIREMAANYSLSVYTAQANIEHVSTETMGKVIEVQERQVDYGEGDNIEKRPALFGRIEPNAKAVAYVSSGQSTWFASAEVEPSFPLPNGDVGAYLTGMAFTTKPASVGLPALKFGEQDKEKFITESVPVDNFFLVPEPNPEDGMVRAFITAFKKVFEPAEPNTTNLTEEPMTPEENEKFAALTKQVEALVLLSKEKPVEPTPDAPDYAQQIEDLNKASGNMFTVTPVPSESSELETLKTNFAALSKKVDQMAESAQNFSAQRNPENLFSSAEQAQAPKGDQQKTTSVY